MYNVGCTMVGNTMLKGAQKITVKTFSILFHIMSLLETLCLLANKFSEVEKKKKTKISMYLMN